MKTILFENFENYHQNRLDETIWKNEIGGHGWGNNELQFYVKSDKNLFFKEDGLHIKVIKEDYEHRHYTSCKVSTYPMFSFQYGTIEFCCKLPKKLGTWPAFWMMPVSCHNGVRWPLCGEIDLLEHVGRANDEYHFTIHMHDYNGKLQNQRTYVHHDKLAIDEFNTFKIEWKEDGFHYYMNNQHICDILKPSSPTINNWNFDQPFYLIMNLALGGYFSSNPNDDFDSDELIVKYIKVEQED